VQDSLRAQEFSIALPERPTNVTLDPSNWILKRVTYTGPQDVAGQDPVDPSQIRWVISPPRPNPSAGPVSVLLSAPGCESCARSEGPALWVWDVSGRRVGRLQHAEGEAVYSWDGRAFDGGNLPAGVYWIGGGGGRTGAPQRTVRIR